MNPEKNSADHRPSKTQRKKDALALQILGGKLTCFTVPQLRTLPLTEAAISAIEQYNLLPKKHGARKRQLQLIGRLMRSCDYEAVSLAMESVSKNDIRQPINLQRARELSEKILTDGNTGINTVINKHEHLDRQKLRQLCREYSKGGRAEQQKIRSKLINYLVNNLSE